MPEPADKHQPERPSLLLAQEPARTYASGNVPGRRDGAAVVFARTAAPGPARALGDDVRDNTHGQRRIAKGKKSLPV